MSRFWVLVIVLALPCLVFPGFSFSQEIRYQSKDRRDPFMPISQSGISAASERSMQIEGIIYDPKGQSVVIIGGEPYSAGEMIGSQKIVKIERSKITVSSKGIDQDYWVSAAEEQVAKKKK